MQKSICQKGVDLVRAGYKVVPISTGEKFPFKKNWPTLRATEQDVIKWGKSSYYWGFGVLGEFSPGIDIDVSNAIVVKKLLLWCRERLGQGPVRVGNAPRILLPCQPPAGKILGSDKSNRYRSADGNAHQIEIKATGSQWVAYGPHPKTKSLYSWPLGDLDATPSGFLPILTGETINDLFTYFYSLLPPEWENIYIRSFDRVGKVTNDGAIIGAPDFENYKPPLDIDKDKIVSMLTRLDPDSHIEGMGWRSIGMALHHQFEGSEEGKNIFDEWSKRSIDYDQGEIDARWPSWGANTYSGNPITAATIVKLYNIVTEKTEDPTRIKKSKALSDWEKRYALVELSDGSEVHDMGLPIWRAPRRTLNAFREHNSAYSHVITLPDGTQKILPMVDAWRASINTKHFAGYLYRPGEKRYCKKEFAWGDPSLYVNTFFFPPHKEVTAGEIPKRITLVKTFIARLFPEKEECDFIIMWLARLIQRPGVRSFVTPLNITPTTGTGRGLFFEVIRHLIGGHNCHDVSKDDLEGKFNGYLDKCIVAVVQEIKATTGDHKYQMWERMKSLLSDRTSNIRAMHTDSYTSTIYANFIMFSNNLNALPIEDPTERRVFVTRGASAPMPPEEVEALLSWLKDELNVSAFFSYLSTYAVDHDAFKRARVTETKLNMCLSSGGEGKADLRDWLNSEAPEVFDFDYALTKLSEYSQEVAENGLSRIAFRHSVADFGWRSERISIAGIRRYVYYNPNKIAKKEVRQKAESLLK